MDHQDLPPAAGGCRLGRARDAVGPEQVAILESVFGIALEYGTFTSEEARLLIALERKLAEEFGTFLRGFLEGIRVDVAECALLDFRDESALAPLEELREACGLATARPVPDTWCTDPDGRISGGAYHLAAFRKRIRGIEVRGLLKPQGYRPATLRETLVLLRRDPKLLDRYPTLFVFGSGAAYGATHIPELRKGPGGERSLRFRRGVTLRPGTYRTIIAER